MKKILLLLIMCANTFMALSQDMFIYGYDTKYKYYGVFLGKINAANDDDDSIWNTDGKYGCPTSEVSIWNANGTYGSLISDCSPFNSDAKYPPKVLDEKKQFYGYFTTDLNRRQRCAYGMTDVICANHDKIAANIEKWYYLIFN